MHSRAASCEMAAHLLLCGTERQEGGLAAQHTERDVEGSRSTRWVNRS